MNSKFKNLTTMMCAVDEDNLVRPGYILAQNEETTFFNTLHGYQINVQTSRVFATIEEAEAERDEPQAKQETGTMANKFNLNDTVIYKDSRGYQTGRVEVIMSDGRYVVSAVDSPHQTTAKYWEEELMSEAEYVDNSEPVHSEAPAASAQAVDVSKAIARVSNANNVALEDVNIILEELLKVRAENQKLNAANARIANLETDLATAIEALVKVTADRDSLRAELITAWKYVDDIAPNKAAEKEAKKQLKKLGVKSTYN